MSKKKWHFHGGIISPFSKRRRLKILTINCFVYDPDPWFLNMEMLRTHSKLSRQTSKGWVVELKVSFSHSYTWYRAKILVAHKFKARPRPWRSLKYNFVVVQKCASSHFPLLSILPHFYSSIGFPSPLTWLNYRGTPFSHAQSLGSLLLSIWVIFLLPLLTLALCFIAPSFLTRSTTTATRSTLEHQDVKEIPLE